MNCICPTHHSIDKDGYPRVKHQAKLWRLNRLIWTLLYGPLPVGQVVAHHCNNKGCVNPEHFYLTSPQQNSIDAARDGLYRRGEDHHKTRWSKEELEEMNTLYYEFGHTQADIGDSFGITQSRVSECLRRYKKMNDYR